jgi:hypothetical protein
LIGWLLRPAAQPRPAIAVVSEVAD